MKTTTKDDSFNFQMEEIFEQLEDDYKDEQESRKKNGVFVVQTFHEWLWDNVREFGELVYSRYNEYAGMEEKTEKYNYQ